MLAGSSAYRKRLVRMKTVSSDCGKHHRSVLLSDSPASTGESSAPTNKQRATAGRSDPIRALARRASDQQPTELWMRQAPAVRRHRNHWQVSNASIICLAGDSSSPTSTTISQYDQHQQHQQQCQYSSGTPSLLDLQTNNSRRETDDRHRVAGGGTSSAVGADVLMAVGEGSPLADCMSEDSEPEIQSEIQNSNAASDSIEEVSNENAVAKGANALVKQATSRQTEIIDTSKLLEEGKVETQYEEPMDEPEEIEETDYALIDEYERSFAYARRLRALLNMKFKVIDRSSIETNFLMVKAHDHPTQRVLDRWRNVDLGQAYDSQIRLKKLIDDFKQTCTQKKKPKKGEVRIPVYPEWMRFTFRFKKDASEKRWADFTAYKQRMKKLSGGVGAVPKANDKYLPGYYDVWSTSITVFAKPETTLLDMVDPVFAKLGLDARADFKFTIGCFLGDKRAGKAKIQGAPSVAEEVTMQALCDELYKRSCSEIFVNENRIEMFKAFPTFYDANSGGDKKSQGSKEQDKGKGGKEKKKGGKNQSNLSATNAASVTTDEVEMADLGNNASRLKERVLTARLSMVRQHLRSGPLVSNLSSYSEAADGYQQPQGGDTANTAEAVDTRAVFTGATTNSTSTKKKITAFDALVANDYIAKGKSSPDSTPAEPDFDDKEVEEDFDSSPSATNQNLSIHDCDSSDESQPTMEELIASTKICSGET